MAKIRHKNKIKSLLQSPESGPREEKKKEKETKKCVRAAVPSSSSYLLSAFLGLLLALLSHAATNNNDDISSSASLVSVLSFHLRDLVHFGTLHLQNLLFCFLPFFFSR
jgi:hypothetical protein